MKPLTFRHRYYKLAQAEFTTIRGKAQFTRLTVGMEIPVETPAGNFTAVITALELKRVDAMPLEFLKADAEYPGCTISEPIHFVNLLNSFRAPAWARCTLDSELTIIRLRKKSSLGVTAATPYKIS
jgi:hypothetical protein